MQNKKKYQSILVNKNKNETARQNIKVTGLQGQIALVISYDDYGKAIWQALHKSTLMLIYSSTGTQLKMTQDDMVASKWMYGIIMIDAAVIKCICLEKLTYASKKKKASRKNNNVSKNIEYSTLFSNREQSNEHEGLYEAVEEQAYIPVVAVNAESSQERDVQSTQLDSSTPTTRNRNEASGFIPSDTSKRDNEFNNDTSDDSTEWFLKRFNNVLSSNDDKTIQSNFFRSAEPAYFKLFFDLWNGERSWVLENIDNFKSFLELEVAVCNNLKIILLNQASKDNNVFLKERYQHVSSVMSEIPYFHEFCFLILAHYHLDMGQLCDILDFYMFDDDHDHDQFSFLATIKVLFSNKIADEDGQDEDNNPDDDGDGQDDEDNNCALSDPADDGDGQDEDSNSDVLSDLNNDVPLSSDNDNPNENWFIEAKAVWLKRKFDITYFEDRIIQELAEYPWTVVVYKEFLDSFSNDLKSITHEELRDYNLLHNLNTQEVLNMIFTSNGLTEFKKRLDNIKTYSDLYDLCKKMDQPQLGKNLNLVLKNIKQQAELVSTITNAYERTNVMSDKVRKNKILGILYHSYNYQILGSSLYSPISLNKDTDTIYQEYIIDTVFHRTKEVMNSLNDICQYICKDDSSYLNVLLTEVDLFIKVGGCIEKERSRTTQVPNTRQEDLYPFFAEDFKYLCRLKEASISPFEMYGDFKDLLHIFQIMKYCIAHFEVRDVQLVAILYMLFHPKKKSKGVLAQIFTGEGKTMIVAMIAGYYCLKKKKVDILTSSTELSIPNLEKCKPFFDHLDLSVAALDSGKPDIPYAEINVLYATPSSYIREQLNDHDPLKTRIPFNRRAEICIVDEVDNMLFDSSSALIQLSSIETTALMPLHYSLLTKIYYAVVKGYSGFKLPDIPKEVDTERGERLLINHLKEIFKVPREMRILTPAERVESILSANCINLFDDELYKKNQPLYCCPNLTQTPENACAIDFDFRRLLQVSVRPRMITEKSLCQIIKQAVDKTVWNKQKVYFHLMSFDISANEKEIWVYCKTKEISEFLAWQTFRCGRSMIRLSQFQMPDKVEKVDICFSSTARIKADLDQSLRIAKKLDNDCGLDFGCDKIVKFFNRVGKIKVEQHLDIVIAYLRKVHYYSYYSGTQYTTIGMLLHNEISIKMRRIEKDENINSIEAALNLDTEIRSFLCTPPPKQHLITKYLEEKNLTKEYSALIHNLPTEHALHAVLQFDLWVENCYKAIMYYSINVGYIKDEKTGKNIKIDESNTGVLQKNTHLMDGLQQFLSMKENSILNSGTLTSSLKGITQFFMEYQTIYGLTGTIGDAATKKFLCDVYKVSIVEVPPHHISRIKDVTDYKSFYRCYEYPGLVFGNQIDWAESIIESTRFHLMFNRPVLVFCQSVRILHDVFKKLFRKRFPNHDILLYDAVNALKSTNIDKPIIILATNIAGRGTDFKIVDETMQKAGGLHICLTYLPGSTRVELQCVGRTARSGDMGSAQLILYDYSSANLSISELRYQRDMKNQEVTTKSRNQVTKLDTAYQLYTSFLGVLSETYEKIASVTRRKHDLAELKSDWDRDIEPTLRDDFSKRKDKTQNYQEWSLLAKTKYFFSKIVRLGYPTEVSERLNNAFVKNQQIEAFDSYDKYRLSCMKQSWAFWMKRNFWSKSDSLFLKSVEQQDSILEKHKIFLKNLQRSNKIIEHNVFISKQVFQALLNKAGNKLSRADLQDLFDRCSIYDIISQCKKGNQRCFSGICLYYYAGFLFKKLTLLSSEERVSSDTKHKLTEIKDILVLSRVLIRRDIFEFLNTICTDMYPTRLVYYQLDGIRRTFDHLLLLIQKQIDQFKKMLKIAEAIPFRYYVLDIEQFGIKINSGVETDMQTITTVINNHCKAFGYFGFATFVFAEYHHKNKKSKKEPTYRTETKRERVEIPYKELWPWQKVAQYWRGTKYYRWEEYTVNSQVNNVAVESNEVVATEFANDQSIVFNLDNELKVDLASARTRMEMQLTLLGKRMNPTHSGARAMLMHLQTQQGISQVDEDTRKLLQSRDSLSRKHFDAVQVTGVKIEKYQKRSNASNNRHQSFVNKKDNNIKNYAEQYYSIFMDISAKYIKELLPIFLIDNYNQNDSFEKILRGLGTQEAARLKKQTKDRIKRTIKDKKRKRGAVEWYVKAIYKKFEPEKHRAYDICEARSIIKEEAREEVAEQNSLSFYLEMAAIFQEVVRKELEERYRKKATIALKKLKKTERQIDTEIAKELEEHIETKSRKLHGCMCCNRKISVNHKLQNISNAFELIITLYQLPLRSKVFVPSGKKPRGAERVTLCIKESREKTQKIEWSARGKNSSCLIEVLSSFYKLDLEEALEDLSSGVEEAEKVDDEITLEVTNSETKNLSWHDFYPNKQELNLLVKQEKYSSTSCEIIYKNYTLLPGLHLDISKEES